MMPTRPLSPATAHRPDFLVASRDPGGFHLICSPFITTIHGCSSDAPDTQPSIPANGSELGHGSILSPLIRLNVGDGVLVNGQQLAVRRGIGFAADDRRRRRGN